MYELVFKNEVWDSFETKKEAMEAQNEYRLMGYSLTIKKRKNI